MDYISREALPDEISADGMSDTAVAFASGYNTCLSDVLSIPAADVRPVVKAKWVDLTYDPEDGHTYAECTACHHVRIIDNYCGYCGAKMEETE